MADSDSVSDSPQYENSYYYFFLFLLLVLLAVAIFFFYTQYQQERNLNLNAYRAPTAVQCPDPQCPSGNLTDIPDGKGLFETLNWCSVQAPATSFVQAMAVGAGLETAPGTAALTPPSKDEVVKFAEYYNQYTVTCGQSWKNAPPKELKNGKTQSDPVVVALVAYAAKLGITNDSNITALKAKNDKITGS